MTAQVHRRAELLLLSRLALTTVSFGIALGLEGPGGELSETARHGLSWTVALAFGATGVSAIFVRRIERLGLFASIQIALDVAIVTSLVHFSGGHESLFAFLYVVVTVYGALLFERWGAVLAASLSAACYGAVLLAANGLWPGPPMGAEERLELTTVSAVWGIHVGALYLVGALASVLSRELRRTGQALNRRTSDLIWLRDLHQRMVESIMSGLLTADREGRITSFNPEAEQITGMCADDVFGRDVDDVIPGAREAVMRPNRRGEASLPSRNRIPYRNGRDEALHLGLAGSILWDEKGSPAGHVIIFQDVTEVVEMERQLRRSERLAAVGEMSAKMAHEIRNPLAAISGSVQVLRSGPSTQEPEQARLMDIVVREADRLNDLIRDFLTYARPAVPNPRPVSLDRLVEDLAELLRSSLPAAVSLEVDAASDLWAMVDASQLKQVVWNLCLNAVQAMPDGGRVTIGVRAPEAEAPQGPPRDRRNGDGGGGREEMSSSPFVEIVVTDTGVGIPVEIQEQIFEPFFTTRKEGSGLGLATVHRVVESHGGTLQVESREDSGTTFRIRLPRALEAA